MMVRGASQISRQVLSFMGAAAPLSGCHSAAQACRVDGSELVSRADMSSGKRGTPQTREPKSETSKMDQLNLMGCF